jgi:hypothetical protein
MGDNHQFEEKENVCIVIPRDTTKNAANPIVTTGDSAADNEKAELLLNQQKSKGTCCFLMKFGACNPRNPPCRFYHPPEGDVIDDGISPCAFGLACRQGHTKRVKKTFASREERNAYWNVYFGYDAGESPAVRDANLLQSQLEPWPTSNLRKRLVEDFGESYLEMDPLDRKSLMDLLLQHYEDRDNSTINATNLPSRRNISVKGGTFVDPDLCEALMVELKAWRKKQGNVNTRPSIKATSYLILRAPTELEVEQKQMGTLSRRASKALYKIEKHRSLWDMATKALEMVKPHDPAFLDSFSALAVTYGFMGSPHIDKQNTGPFYGLSLGDFTGSINGGGCVCVEADAFTVAHVSTHNHLSKCDGRYPHWVSSYEGERYSLIYYATSTSKHDFIPPIKAFYGNVVHEGEK